MWCDPHPPWGCTPCGWPGWRWWPPPTPPGPGSWGSARWREQLKMSQGKTGNKVYVTKYGWISLELQLELETESVIMLQYCCSHRCRGWWGRCTAPWCRGWLPGRGAWSWSAATPPAQAYTCHTKYFYNTTDIFAGLHQMDIVCRRWVKFTWNSRNTPQL